MEDRRTSATPLIDAHSLLDCPIEVGNILWSRTIMRVRVTVALCAMLPYLAGCGGVGAPSQVGQPTEQGQAMQRMLADVNQIRGFVYGTGTQDDADRAAADLLSWSQRMAELFPPGQASTEYVDMSPARVSGAPAAMTQSAERLLAAVRTGNRPTIGSQLIQTEHNGCGFCHRSGT
jgi:cytochrome c556